MRLSPLPRACTQMDKLRLPSSWPQQLRYRLPHVRARSKRTQEQSSLQAEQPIDTYFLLGQGGTNGERDDDEGGWVLVWEWGNPSLTVTAPATPTPCPEYALDYTIRLYYVQGGGNGGVHKQEGPRRCTVPQRVPHSYCLFIQCGVKPHRVLETNETDVQIACYSCKPVGRLTYVEHTADGVMGDQLAKVTLHK